MELIYITPQQTTSVKDVNRISLPGSDGNFTVLHGHAPLLTTLVAGDVVYELNGKQEKLTVGGGVVQVEHNAVKVTV